MSFYYSRRKSVIMPIIVTNLFVFMLQMITNNAFNSLFVLQSDILQRPWILLTHMFMHANFTHLFFNMYALLLFGSMLESKIGYKRLLYLYFGSGLTAGIIGSFFYTNALGASAAIMGVIGGMIILMPNLQLLFFFVFPMKLRTAGIIWFLLDFLGLFYESSGVGHLAHLVGMFIGLGYGYYLLNGLPVNNKFKTSNNYNKNIHSKTKNRQTPKQKRETFADKKYITIEDVDFMEKEL